MKKLTPEQKKLKKRWGKLLETDIGKPIPYDQQYILDQLADNQDRLNKGLPLKPVDFLDNILEAHTTNNSIDKSK